MTKRTLTAIADQFRAWVTNQAPKWGAPMLEPPKRDGQDDTRRDKVVQPYFQQARPNQVVAILTAREPARILMAIGDKDNDSPHLEYKYRWVKHDNFYVQDQHWGPMFVRVCPYFPFSARVCLNQHHWLAIRTRAEGLDFQQCTNAFLRCSQPERLQALDNLPALRERMSAIIDNYHNVQQDVLETFVDRGQLRQLAEPTTLPSGKRIPGLKIDHPRQLALMHALVRFAHIAGGGRFTTPDLYPPVLEAHRSERRPLHPRIVTLCQRISDDLDVLLRTVGFKTAA